MKKLFAVIGVIAGLALAGCTGEAGQATIAAPAVTSSQEVITTPSESPSSQAPTPKASESVPETTTSPKTSKASPSKTSEQETSETSSDIVACDVLTPELATQTLGSDAVLVGSEQDDTGSSCSYTNHSQNSFVGLSLIPLDGHDAEYILDGIRSKDEDKGCDTASKGSSVDLEEVLGKGAFLSVCPGDKLTFLIFPAGDSIALIGFDDAVSPNAIGTLAAIVAY